MTQTIASPFESVRDLIEEVEQYQNREHLERSVIEWRLVLRQFRKVELRFFLAEEPEAELAAHEECVKSLLTMGEALECWLKEAGRETEGESLGAAVEGLRISLQMWHHNLPEDELNRIREVIFGGAS